MQTDQTELLAIHLYQSHCRAMDVTEHLDFFTDPSFVTHANAWRTVAEDALIYLEPTKAIAELNDRLINRREAYEEYIAKGKPHSASWFQGINHPDARLIAAAPDLLEALIEARGQMTNIRYNKPRIGMEAACASADKAIAKAKGETP